MLSMSAGAHTRIQGGSKLIWNVEALWAHARSFAPSEVNPRSVIDLNRDGWFCENNLMLR